MILSGILGVVTGVCILSAKPDIKLLPYMALLLAIEVPIMVGVYFLGGFSAN